MKKVFSFLAKSSADPSQTSLTVKFALLGIIPYAMQALSLVCEFGSQCYSIDPTLLETIASAIAEAVFYFLTLVSIGGALYGLGRKLYRTFRGENLALLE